MWARNEAVEEHDGADADNFFDYAFALERTLLESQGNMHLHSDDWHRTIYIDTLDVGTWFTDYSGETPSSGSGRARRITYRTRLSRRSTSRTSF